MPTFDDLMREAAKHSDLPPRFAEGVMARLDARFLLRQGFLLCGSVVLFFYALSFLLLDILTAQTMEFFSVALLEPAILSSREGWYAMLEVFPISSVIFTVTTAFLVILLSRIFVARVPSLFFSLRHAV